MYLRTFSTVILVSGILLTRYFTNAFLGAPILYHIRTSSVRESYSWLSSLFHVIIHTRPAIILICCVINYVLRTTMATAYERASSNRAITTRTVVVIVIVIRRRGKRKIFNNFLHRVPGFQTTNVEAEKRRKRRKLLSFAIRCARVLFR